MFLAESKGTGLFEWGFAVVPMLLFGAVTAGLWAASEPRPELAWWLRTGRRVGDTLERITGFPGWAVATVSFGLFALLVAVIGFYWDVSWHIDFGRDKELFTPPHTMILLGLGMILASAVTEVVLATASDVPTRIRWRGLRIPWSAVPLGAIGMGALAGFPLDEIWHRAYGIDVTMWSPSHLLMIGGASLVPAALWLVMTEAGIRPADGWLARSLHVIVAGATLTGLSTLQGEFDFGVPQFQLLYHPVLIALAAGIGLTAGRLVLGRWGALRTAVSFLALRGFIALMVGPVLGHTVPHIPLYLGSAVAVEAAAFLAGTVRSGRFALLAGVGVGTVGLAEAWGWSHIWSYHPWGAALIPSAIVVSVVAAVGAAAVGTAFGSRLAGLRANLPRWAGVAAGAAILLALALPFPRTADHVVGQLSVEPVGDAARVGVQLAPADAADDARWFEVLSWQGGSLVLTPLRETGPGTYEATEPVPASGSWKSLLRLHRGKELTAIPVYMPPDLSIGAPPIPATERVAQFDRDTKLLLRETKSGPSWPALIVYIAVLIIAIGWLFLLGLAAARMPVPERATPLRAAA